MLALTLTLAAALTATDAADIRCVALLAIVANEQRRATGWTDYPDVQRDGARFSGVVGVRVVAGGKSRETVRDAILAEVAEAQKRAILPRAEIDRCAARARLVAPAPPSSTLPRCAAIIGAAYDAVKAREGLTKNAMDLATLAAVLTYRARESLTGAGKSGPEADTAIAAERTRANKDAAAPDEELTACADLAAPGVPK